MKDLGLWSVGDPSLLVISVDSCSSLTALMPPSGSVGAVRLDGRSLGGAHDVFGQVSAALRFPVYFGWNWDALSDCLCDLSWYPADRYLIVIDHAEDMLIGRAEERKILFSILSRAAREWANSLGKSGGVGFPFKVVLLCAEKSVDALRIEAGCGHDVNPQCGCFST